jgi:GDP-mannose transporter
MSNTITKTQEDTEHNGMRSSSRMDSSERSLEDVEMNQPLVSKSSSSSPLSAALDGRNSKGIFQNFYDESNKNGKVLSACAFYSFCSVSMVLTNKSLASRCVCVCVYVCMSVQYVCEMQLVLIPCLHIYEYVVQFSDICICKYSYNYLIEGDLNILLVVIQAIVAVIAVEGCKCLKWVEYPNFSFQTAREWAPVNIFFCLMLFTGMTSLQHNSVPMVTIFKNITNIITTIGDYYFFGSSSEALVIVAFGIMLGGAILAAWNDISVSPKGLVWMILNCFSCSGYVLYMKFATKTVKLSKFGMVFYNNLLCIFFLLPAAMAMGQVQIFAQTKAIHTTDYMSKNFFAGLVGFLLNFASLNCVSLTGPTTYAIIGSLNKVPIAILGYFIFDSTISNDTWFFISVSMAGGFLFSYSKLQTANSRRETSRKF